MDANPAFRTRPPPGLAAVLPLRPGELADCNAAGF